MDVDRQRVGSFKCFHRDICSAFSESLNADTKKALQAKINGQSIQRYRRQSDLPIRLSTFNLGKCEDDTLIASDGGIGLCNSVKRGNKYPISFYLYHCERYLSNVDGNVNLRDCISMF